MNRYIPSTFVCTYRPYSVRSQANEPMEDRTTSKFVVLLRVSTTKQGAEGLGIDAQKRDIDLFLKQQENPEVVAELVEVESGGKELCDRPVLQEAINLFRSPLAIKTTISYAYPIAPRNFLRSR